MTTRPCEECGVDLKNPHPRRRFCVSCAARRRVEREVRRQASLTPEQRRAYYVRWRDKHGLKPRPQHCRRCGVGIPRVTGKAGRREVCDWCRDPEVKAMKQRYRRCVEPQCFALAPTKLIEGRRCDRCTQTAVNRLNREKYRSDPEFRAKVRDMADDWAARNKAHRNEYNKHNRRVPLNSERRLVRGGENNGQPWLPGEDAALASDKTDRHLAIILGRSQDAVRNRRQKLRRKEYAS